MLKSISTYCCFVLVLGAFVLAPQTVQAQNSRDVETPRVPSQLTEQPTNQKQKKISRRKAKKQLEQSYSAYFNRLVVEYEDRMKANAKKNYLLAKELQKPRYSDPSYFGHKKPPKKRANGKKRKCKECHMWH